MHSDCRVTTAIRRCGAPEEKMTGSENNACPFAARQVRLQSLLEKRRIPLLLVTKPVNIFYLTGFRGSAGVAVFGGTEPRLWVDPRYSLQAQEQARGVKVINEKKSLLTGVARW